MDKQTFREIVQPYSITSAERIEVLYDALEHIRVNKIEGDYVECGVFQGGNILGIMKYLESYQSFNKNVWLYDTFEGMTAPEAVDCDLHETFAGDIWKEVQCVAALELVKGVVSQSRFPEEKTHFIKGDVCQTLLLEKNIPDSISLLRLDTDFHASTKVELEVLWEKVSPGGVLIIDDYGHWQGCKKAVDEFFGDKASEFTRVDYTCISLIKKNTFTP